jgi:hypothetical protein
MEGLVLKLAYTLAGLLAGYLWGKRFVPDTFEKVLYVNLRAGKTVMVAVDEKFTSYQMVDGKIVVKMGELTVKEKNDTDAVVTDGLV